MPILVVDTDAMSVVGDDSKEQSDERREGIGVSAPIINVQTIDRHASDARGDYTFTQDN